MKYDVVIIGAGILGCLTARQLSRYRLSVLVIDKEPDIGEGATKANSGVLYAGFHPRGGSLKGISCARGNRMHQALCRDLDVPMEYVGSLFVAFHEEGIEQIEEKMKKGRKNGVEGMEMISGDEARRLEPALSEKVIAAMYAPTTGIISPFKLVLHTALNAVENGVAFQFDTAAENIEDCGDFYRIHTNRGTITADYIVNTSGEGAADLERFVRPRDLIIKPKRGEYLVFDTPSPIKHVIYQAQEHDEKGTLLAPTTDGNMLAGPTSYKVRSYQCTETSQKGHDHITHVAKKILPGLDLGNVIASFAGVRANIENVPKEEKDFVVRTSGRNFVSALGIKNPGMTASPYLADKITGLLFDSGLRQEENRDFNPIYRAKPLFLKADRETQKRLLAEDPAYGNAVCRCEGITEGDIRSVLNSPLPPHNLNGLKKRLRTGMGRCQGGFCTPQIIDILCRQWNVPPEKVCKNGPKSSVVKGRLR
ncbi:NAD(P)/FAD-dependent oxidoreductase [Anaerovorax odorimutans]|uniref:NAD(P)/FAD-dependent oxidoreductase n=1 Tax=Anaerovorax odorimutans TaxID=109327 RepID=A0ABT1RKD5_9FIRM|nr:NAD(P)/FAD-dependent oxidoreductase [Anaerovorax odorimutans]MCQ4635637.1 NAD(P)/FAD-dependent oxidoreductase [Anaerovorax odorimutans]